MTAQDVAQVFAASGLSVIPIAPTYRKAPAIPSWNPFKLTDGAPGRIMTPEEISRYFAGNVGIAIVAGSVSGNLEILDIEHIAPFQELVDLINEHLPGFLPTLPQVLTPKGGRHIYYRCSTIADNQKLAEEIHDGKRVTVIETRGEGGYVLTVGSPQECHDWGNKPELWGKDGFQNYRLVVGKLTKIPTITPEQREILLSCCRSFNRLVREQDSPPVSTAVPGQGLRPGDDYNARGDVLSLLVAHGWKISGRHNGSAYLTRPGKEHGISASFGKIGPNAFYTWSSNAAPFEPERKYDAFRVFAELEHKGDIRAAAQALNRMGYGEQLKREPAPKPNGHAIEEPPMPGPERNVPLEFAAETMTITQDNCARLFEQTYGNDFKYCRAWGQWLKWDNRWKPETTDLAFDQCRLLVRSVNFTMNKETAKASFAAGVERFARGSRTFATTVDQWDANDWLLNLPTGTVNLRSEGIHAHRREDFITKITSISPTEGKTPVFDRFMRDITLDDPALIEYHQVSLGACLSGAIQDNFLLFWYGTGQNGKNTFGDLITWILGDYAKVIPVETLMVDRAGARHPTDLANLRGIRLAVSSEVEEGSYFNEQRIKALTGDAMISARYMRQDFFEFRRTHKHLIYGNHRPLLRVVDPAIQSRLHIVPFKAYFPPEARDPDIPRRLRIEAPHILNWLIAGHSKWLEAGYLKKCSAVQKETDSYFEAQSTPDMWIQECCIVRDGELGSAKELFQSYKRWKESRGEGVMSQTRWGEWMRRFVKKRHAGGIYYEGIDVSQIQVL